MNRVLEWHKAAFLHLAVIDAVSRRLRAAIIGAPRN